MIFSLFLGATRLFAQDDPPKKEAVDEEYKGPSGQAAQGGKAADGAAGGNQSGQAGAAGAGDVTAQPLNANPTTMDFISMILGLLVVIAVIYLIFWFLKKRMKGRIVENELIRILGSRIISGTKSLHLVEVGGAIYLVGSANDSISLISEITQKEAKDSIRLAASQTAGPARPRFIDALAAMFKPGVKRQLEINEGIDFMRKQRDRLKKFK